MLGGHLPSQGDPRALAPSNSCRHPLSRVSRHKGSEWPQVSWRGACHPENPAPGGPTELQELTETTSVLTLGGSQVLGVALLQGAHRVQGCLGPAHQVVCEEDREEV